MLLRRFTDFILQGRPHAMATAFLFAYVPFIGSISIIIAALVALRKGVVEGLLVTVAATVPYLLTYAMQPSTGFWLVAVIIISNILTFLFAILLRKYDNWSLTLDSALVLGVIAIGLVHVVYPDIQNWWGIQFTNYLSKNSEVLTQFQPQTPEATQAIVAQMATAAKKYATGFITVSILFNALLQLVLARWWQAAIFNPGGLRKELYGIRLSYITGFLFVIGVVLAYLGNATGLDIMPVVYGIYCAAGLSLLHAIMSLRKLGWLWLTIIYMSTIWLFPLSAVVIAFIALLDVSIDFRKRLYKI